MTAGLVCSDSDEAVRFHKVQDAQNPCCDEYRMEGVDSGCHFPYHTKDDILKCMRGKHLLLFGGSTMSGMALNLMQLLNPTPFPAIARDWVNCTSDCDDSIAPTMADLVVNEDGKVLSVLSDYSEPFTPMGEMNSSLQMWISKKMSRTPTQGTGLGFV